MTRQEMKRRISKKRRSMNQVYPGGVQDVKEFTEQGMDAYNLDDVEEQQHALDTIRKLPCKLSVKKEFSAFLLHLDFIFTNIVYFQNWRKLKFFCKGVSYKLELWGSWLRKIEGHQGTGCVSYFVFLRWLFGLNIFLFILLFLAVTLPFVALSSLGYGYSVTGSSTDSDTTTAATCSAIYTSSINVSSSASDLILDFVQGTGWMENTALFYGYYNSIEITVTAFKENLLASQDGAQATVYCNKVFGGWDFALKEAEAAKLKNKSIYKDLVADLAEQKFRLTQKHKTRGQKCGLYTVRFFINLLVLILLAGAGAAIYFAQNFATTFANSDTSGYDNFVVLLVGFLPSLTITALNAALPLLFGILVEFERYRPAFKIKITLARSVFLRLASLAVLIVTIYNNMTCVDKETTCNTGQNSCVSLKCWETFVGQSFYKLVVMDFLVHLAVTLIYELPRKLITTKCTCGLLNKLGPAEFDIPKNVLDLVYTQTLCWIGYQPCIIQYHQKSLTGLPDPTLSL
ncbi:hypothetical protein KUTeg_003630 [Tegillarca granosa]|uniref:TMC domain-containing protein n=1 Tax=Tegillarca granosa TaxID=220873 RepID=A0ABQ9FMM7_TEGGR|nr:hypothetical protein KUTeg_003630 [Tegillarca granosa]